ncbi:hypothetical protein LCGC14_0594940 [marine sediment metagenome]|uniref:Uncharacterized protein n=1 Tax=marine sediment metagenome TaxID=412755 RepID=A0A0F9TYI9_9ZZZZ
MRKVNNHIKAQDLDDENQRYFQTNLLDFLKLEKKKKTQEIKINQISTIRLQKIVQNQQFKVDIANSFEELNDNNWIAIENNKYFVSSDKHMVVSDFSNYKSLIKLPNSVKLLFEVSTLYNFNEIILKKGENNRIRIKKFNYHLSNLNETYRFLSFPFKICQNEEGLLICTNMKYIILIAPKLI